MPAKTWSIGIIFALKKLGPVYSLLRGIKRITARFGRFFFVEGSRRILRHSSRLGPPTGHFSACEALRRKELPGRLILTDQGQPPLHEKSMMVLCGLRQHLEQPWPIFWTGQKGARLVGPTLGLVNQQKQLADESAYGPERFKTDPAFNHPSLFPPRHLDGRWTSVVSNWVPVNQPTNFAHWFFDALPRLAVMNELPTDTRVLVPRRLQQFQADTLSWLGLHDRYRLTEEKHLLIDDYFFSSPPTMVVCYNPYAVQFLRSSFLPFADKDYDPPRRFYIQRAGQWRAVANEEQVTEFFRNRGWAIVDTAALPLARQIQLFSQAEAICGAHGAAFTNAVWCKANCYLLELFSDAYLSGCYEWLADCVNARHSFLVFPSDHFTNARVDLQKLQSHLRALGLD